MQENRVKISDLMSNRFDPYFHLPRFYNEMEELKKSPFKIYKLIDLCTQITDGTHYTPTYTDSGIKFISVKDIKENSIDFDNTKFISQEEHNLFIKRCNPEPGDLLLTKIGTIGNVCIVPNDAPDFSIFVSVALLKLNKNIVSPIYMQAALSTYFAKSQMQRELKGIGVPDLHLENICNIQIPIPDKVEEQNKIAEILQKAYIKKQIKHTKAQDLIASVNKFVSDKLNIKSPKINKQKVYKVAIDNLYNNRIDTKYHQPKYEELEKNIQSNNKKIYSLVSLDNICEEVISGQRPKGGVSQISEGIPSIGGEHVYKDGTIATENLKYIPEDFHNEQLKSRIEPLDIILVKDGATTGKVGIIPENYPFKDANINEHVFILRCKDNINPYYLLTFLMSDIGQMEIEREISGATIMGISKDSLKNILIPIPNISIQNSISIEYKKCLEQAEQLKSEANKEYKKAKERVENIILGKENL